MTDTAPEYTAARAVLLDALAALDSHRRSLVLVGAQAVYLHTGAVPGTGAPMTTDSDLAVDADLLSDEPEITGALRQAHFTAVRDMPGQWENPQGIRVDLMAVPHQSNRPHGSRAARLPPHGREVARITPGLEPALVDNCTMTIQALASGDDRRIDLRVAGPAALLTAKLAKLRERYEAMRAGRGRPDRLKQKDVLDCYRILVAIETADLVAGFETHRAVPHAHAATRAALAFFDQERRRGDDGALRLLLARALPDDLPALASFDVLSTDLVEALKSDLLASDGDPPLA